MTSHSVLEIEAKNIFEGHLIKGMQNTADVCIDKNQYFSNYAKTIYMHWFDYEFSFLVFKIHGVTIYLKDLENI